WAGRGPGSARASPWRRSREAVCSLGAGDDGERGGGASLHLSFSWLDSVQPHSYVEPSLSHSQF
uniref:Uncharacterized protein n=1 Tax=Colobus angolensis palliatus TaxID=336983 RepID=A0A2K5HGK7_COLAP